MNIEGGERSDQLDKRWASKPALNKPALPLRVGLLPRDGDAGRLYLVTVTANDADGALLSQARVISGYVSGSIRYARLVLEDTCLGVTKCSDDAALTCVAGSCVSAHVDAKSFSAVAERPTTLRGARI